MADEETTQASTPIMTDESALHKHIGLQPNNEDGDFPEPQPNDNYNAIQTELINVEQPGSNDDDDDDNKNNKDKEEEVDNTDDLKLDRNNDDDNNNTKSA
eukprot:117453_1